MSLITTDYFNYDINIPDSNYSDLGNVITRYEPVVLKRLLGYELWKLVEAYDSGSPQQRILDLVEGKEYTVDYNGRTQTIKWNGLINDEKVSLIAFYVYFWWQKNNYTTTGNLGESINKVEDSIRVSPNQKMGSSWVELRKLYGHSDQLIIEPSAYNFLKNFEDDYEEWIFTDIGQVNMFGL